nr:sigma-E processing peptidase SpoIIGA [bacterium]
MFEVIGEWVFLQNMLLNLGLILTAARLARVRLRMGFACLAAAWGGVYAVLALYRPMGWPSQLAMPFLMCLIALIKSRAPRFRWLAMGGWLMGASAALAGLALMLGLLFEGGCWVGGVYQLPALPMALLTVATAAGGIWLRVDQGRRVVARQQAFHARMTILWHGRCCQVQALIDTGNTMREPLGGLPVAVVERGVLAAAFGPQALVQKHGRPVAFETLTGPGQARAFMPDALFLRLQGREKPCRAWIAPVDTRFGEGIRSVVPIGILP